MPLSAHTCDVTMYIYHVPKCVCNYVHKCVCYKVHACICHIQMYVCIDYICVYVFYLCIYNMQITMYNLLKFVTMYMYVIYKYWLYIWGTVDKWIVSLSFSTVVVGLIPGAVGTHYHNLISFPSSFLTVLWWFPLGTPISSA